MTRGFLPLFGLVLAAGVASLSYATDGFRVVTTDGARRLAIQQHPQPIPDVTLIDQDGATLSPATYRGKTLLVDFIYTDCPTICGVLGEGFGQVLPLLHHDEPVDLLSISFDPTHDTQAALKAYGARFGATAPSWRVAVPATATGLQTLLRSFGVIVIPDKFGGFTHNDGIYLIDRTGRLVRILDPQTPPAALLQAARAVS